MTSETSSSDALFAASKSGWTDDVAELLRRGGLDLNKTDATGATPLHYAAAANHVGVVQQLLKAKANPNKPNGIGDSPLHKAAARGAADACRELVAAGGNPLLKNTAGQTPLQLAKNADTKQAMSPPVVHDTAEEDELAKLGQEDGYESE